MTRREVLLQQRNTSQPGRVALHEDGTYPAMIEGLLTGETFVLGRLPKRIAWWDTMVALVRGQRWVRETPAIYYVLDRGTDAACLTCMCRIHYDDWREADAVLAPCRKRGHATLLMHCHIADAAPWTEPLYPHVRTVGDLRHLLPLLEDIDPMG
jgi:hypothetical protein